MKRIFSLLSAVALFGGAVLVTSCNDKESQSLPKITFELPLLDTENEYYVGDSIRIKYFIEDVDKIRSIKSTVRFDFVQKPLPSGIPPAPVYDKSYSDVGEKFAVDEKFKIDIADLYGRVKNHFLVEVVAEDGEGNTFKYSRRIYVSSL
ncbi:MAG: hypothetical protein KA841_01905 [Chitinophagales bacterium]|nr:hypothetical protein [Chitinophagales bacterium]